MLNRCVIQGRLTADPELRHTPNGIAVATFTLACDRDYKSKEAGAQTCDFINVVVWRNSAEFVSKYFTKGQMALVDGRLTVRSYNDREGTRRTTAEIVAESVNFCGSKKDNAGGGYSAGNAAPDTTYAPPATAKADGGAATTPTTTFEELGEDDGELPF